ncbi:hypothetical protein GCM10023100_53270 [Actinocorallia cavernae]|uniref:Uncharacterized protein n=2 Tax=Actinomycetes TaxID=1760 RepID=A0ABP5Y6V5_9ACTN
MAPDYPRENGIPLPEWSAFSAETREHLAGQTPYRLQKIMYACEVGDVPADAFAADVAAADHRLCKLLEAEPAARRYFGDWTFAKVAHDSDTMRAAEAEYYLCDALIEYGNQRYGWVWNKSFPVLDHTLYGRYGNQPTGTPAPETFPAPETAYALAPSIASEIRWTTRTVATTECFTELDRDYYLRKAALLDRIALLDDPLLSGGDSTETAIAAALVLLDSDRPHIAPHLADRAEKDPRGYVRHQYAQRDVCDDTGEDGCFTRPNLGQ